MNTTKLLLLAAAGMLIPASAALASPQMSVRQMSKGALSNVAGVPVKVTPVQKAAESSYAKYGELIQVLEEDFSLMTSGSKGAPDFKTIIWNEQQQGDEDFIPWTNLKPEYTHQPLWGGYNVFQAGGMVYVDQTTNYCHINTPYTIDVSDNGGICVLQFDVETVDDTTPSAGVMMEAAETNNMGRKWNEMGQQFTGEIPAGKHHVECLFYGGGKTTLFNIIPTGTEAVYIDNLKVFSLKQHVSTPVLLKHSEYKGTSFKANWEPVEGADSYLVSVYSVDSADEMNPISNYVVTDKQVTENSAVIDGIQSGVTYYYTVKSVKGEYESLPSLPMKVLDIEAPVMNEPTVAEDGSSYTASWSEPPMAEVYNYMALRERVADADGPFVIADEDFTGIANHEGITVDWTFDDPDPEAMVYDYFDITTGMTQRGWHALNATPYYNSLCIDAFHYFWGEEQSALISPELDLSKDGGKATVSITAAGEFIPFENTGVTDLQGNPVDLQVEAAVAVFNYNEKTRDFDQVELIYAHDVNPAGTSPDEMRPFTFNITKGTERTIIGIFAVSGPGNLYLDDFKIVQNYKKGDIFYDPFDFRYRFKGPEEKPTEVEVTLPSYAAGQKIYHKVQAVRIQEDGLGQDITTGEFSPMSLVLDPTVAVNGIEAETDAAVSLDGGVLTVTAPGAVSVYGIDGCLVAESSADGVFTCNLPAKGIYLVNAAGKTIKVIY